MKITSIEIKEHEFDRSFRGYNVEEVNNFLDDLGREWDKMQNEIQLLKMQLDVSEKNLAKFQGLEATLLNTLKTSEETSKQKISDAEEEALIIINDSIKKADKTASEAEDKANKILLNAENEASEIIHDAERTSKELIEKVKADANKTKQDALAEVETLHQKYIDLESKRQAIIEQLKSYNLNLTNIINSPELDAPSKPVTNIDLLVSEDIIIDTDFDEPVTEAKQDVETEEPVDIKPEILETFIEEEVSLPSAANKMAEEPENDEKTNLEIIEGIGPAIKEILNNAGILNFRTLAMTPEYKLREILAAAGPQFNMHDPTTWNEQALLAENGKWDELKELQDRLTGGKPEADESQPMEIEGKNTDEMLEKVNKVKAAIRKAMSEKQGVKEDKPKGESFFDGL